MIKSEDVFRPLPGLVSQRAGKEFIIVPLHNKAADISTLFTLNESGAFIWEQLDGHRDVAAIEGLMMEEYGIDAATARHDLHRLLHEMLGKVVERVGEEK